MFAESDGSSTSSTYSVAQQCTCAWLPTYYNGWLELLDSRLPFPLKRTHSLDAAAVPFRRFLVESQGNGAVDMPWRDCPGYKEPDCEMGELDHNWAGKQLRRLLIGVLDYWEEDLKTEVEKYSKEIGVDGLWWVPWAPEEGEGVVESQNVPEE